MESMSSLGGEFSIAVIEEFTIAAHNSSDTQLNPVRLLQGSKKSDG
jgi:hypothetical protein